MSLIELKSTSELKDFTTTGGIVTFSAHWCGPCNASKPALVDLAKEYKSSPRFGIVYESDIGDDIHAFNVRAFPTYVLYHSGGAEASRVEGVNLQGIKEMIQQHYKGGGMQDLGKGETLGGGNAPVVSPEEARALRLARLAQQPAATDATESSSTTPQPMDEDKKGDAEDDKKEEAAKDDVEMDDVDNTAPAPVPTDGTEKLDKAALKTLTEDMGFSLLRAQKGLLNGTGGTLDGAIEWITQHQDDDDIDEPIKLTTEVAQSYKCNECGKILSNMANLELHANKTGHSDFAESTESVKPLTEEEKQAKILEIKQLLKAKRAEREEAEKEDEVQREKARRLMGKEMLKTKEQLEMEQRKRDAQARKAEKLAAKKERERIKAELEKDKRERAANKGRLSSRLGVDGYNPDGIQYDLDADGAASAPGEEKASTAPAKASAKVSESKIDEYISKVASYRAGGDGGKCLKVLKAYIGNASDNPTEDKYKTINTDNKAFKGKVKPFVGAKSLLLAVGFQQNETSLTLKEDPDYELLKRTKEKLEEALAKYNA